MKLLTNCFFKNFSFIYGELKFYEVHEVVSLINKEKWKSEKVFSVFNSFKFI